MIKKIFLIFLFSIGFLFAMSQTRVSVYVSDTTNSISEYKDALTKNIYNYLTKSREYTPVNRSVAIDKVLLNIRNRQQNGNVDFSQVVNTTNEFAESQVIYVEIIEYKRDKMIEFNAQLMDVEKNIPLISTVEYLYKEDLNINSILKVSQNLLLGLGISSDNSRQINTIDSINGSQSEKKNALKKNVDRNAIVASTFVPGAGQFYKENYGAGAAFLCSELVLVGGGTACYFMEKKQRKYLEDNYYFLNGIEIDNLKKKANVCNISMYTCFGIAAAVHIGNMIHAWITPDYKHCRFCGCKIFPTIIPVNDYLSPSYAMGAGVQIVF